MEGDQSVRGKDGDPGEGPISGREPQTRRGVPVDTIALVDEMIGDGRRLIHRLVREGIPVTAACWIKPVEPDRWSLYIATPLLEKGPLRAYGEVLSVLRSLGSPWLTGS